VLSIAPEQCIIVKEKTALKLEATRDYENPEKKISLKAGEEYLIYGPVTYEPKIYETIVEHIESFIIRN